MSKIITGLDLRDDLINLKLDRQPIVCDLIYDRDIFLLTSDAGAGKSIWATQLAACLTRDNSNFLGLDIPNAKKVLYIQLEGDYEESVERLRYMEYEGGLIINEHNLLWMEEKCLDVLDPTSIQMFLEKIAFTEFIPDIVIIDPIYKLSHQDICTGVAALGIIRFSDMLITRWGCSNILIHHNLKDSYTADGKQLKRDDAYYGHSFIKNHVRTSYAMKKTGDNTRDLVRKKGRGSDTRHKMSLEYNPETYTLHIDEHTSTYKRGKHIDRFYAYINDMHKNKRNTDAIQIVEECEISYRQLRTLKSKPETLRLFDIVKTPPNNKEIWKPKVTA